MSDPNTPKPAPKRTPPAAMWFACGALAMISLVQLFEGRGRYATIGVILQAVVLFGLLWGHKWAYVLMMIFTATGIATAFSKNASHGITVLVCDAVVFIPVLLSTSYFFPEQKPTDSPREPQSTNHQQKGNVL